MEDAEVRPAVVILPFFPLRLDKINIIALTTDLGSASQTRPALKAFLEPHSLIRIQLRRRRWLRPCR